MAVHGVMPGNYTQLMEFVCKGIPPTQVDDILATHAVRTALAVFMPDLCIHPIDARALYSERAIVQTLREMGAQYYTNMLTPFDDVFDPDVKPENYSVVTCKDRTFYRRMEHGLYFKAEIDNSREVSVVCVWRKFVLDDAPCVMFRLVSLYFSKPAET